MSKKVLIVEDEITLREPMMLSFKSQGYDVTSATNGEEGLKAALSTQPDMILLDLTMPVMDGVTMLKKLRSDPNGRALQVMVLTNLSDSSKASETAGLGVMDYIVKSDWKLKDIVSRVSEKIGA
jgi:two-component system cell cycle response regulator